jgi:Cyclin, N-terminal domain/Cyclin, C-terminal domain
MSTPEQAPLLALRMKHAGEDMVVTLDDALDRLSVMVKQEAAYTSKDYMGRRRRRTEILQDEEVDPACREKMCEWSYKVCDHFNVSREIVAFAFSFLDRFIDKCSCDRTAFKLASMTCLYISTKMLNMKQISLASLSELSRKEFAPEHLAQMERIILHTLDYRLNPPTVQAFIQQLRACFPKMDGVIAEAIHQRAMFYAELCVYDYSFVTESRHQIAVAAIVNAFNDVEIHNASHYQDEFLTFLESNNVIEVKKTLEKAEGRLRYLLECSAQSQVEAVPLRCFSAMQDLKLTASSEYVGCSPVGVDFSYNMPRSFSEVTSTSY